MRTFSNAVKALIASGDPIKYFFLTKLTMSTTYYFTDHPTDITYDGNTYLSSGVLLGYEPPRQSSVVDREAYRLTFVDHSNVFLAEFRAGVVGKDIEVMAGFLDSTTNQPLLGATDIVGVYKGFIDSPSVTNSFDQKIAVVEGSSPMADLDSMNTLVTSKDGMDQRSAIDTSFDSVFDGSKFNIKWGKI